LRDASLHLELIIPAGVDATLSLPQGWTTPRQQFQEGTHQVVATAVKQ